MPELSIIVPIYNVENYLEKCIKSILAQTFTDFELILVNDGSPDKSDVIMKKYEILDNRIINIFQDNKGVSAARNVGLSRARGKYVAFVDPDDYIEEDTYEKLLPPMRSGGGISFSNWDAFDELGKSWGHNANELKRKMYRFYVLLHYFDMPRPMGGNVVNKIFVKSQIKNEFNEKMFIGEDFLFLLQYLLNMETEEIYFYDEPLYHIFVRSDSATRKRKDKVALVLEAKKQALTLTLTYDKKIFNLAEKEFVDSAYSFIMRLEKDKTNNYYNYSKKKFNEYIQKSWQSVLRNPEIYWKTKVIYIKKYFELR